MHGLENIPFESSAEIFNQLGEVLDPQELMSQNK
jgi:hypothetical protein